MSAVVTPFYRDGEVKYFVGNGTSRKLIYDRAELAALRSAINQALGVNRERPTT